MRKMNRHSPSAVEIRNPCKTYVEQREKIAANLFQFLLWTSVLPEPVQLQTLAVITLLRLLKVTTVNLQRLHRLHCPHHLLLCLGYTQTRTHTQYRSSLFLILKGQLQ